jgi:hypothetical protein
MSEIRCMFCGTPLTGGVDTFGPFGEEYCGASDCQAKASKDEQLQSSSLSQKDLMSASIVFGYTGDLGLAIMTARKR